MTPLLIMAALLTCDAPRVIDGDTLVCAGEHVRLAAIDAPELHGCHRHTPCITGDAQASKEVLESLTRGAVVCQWSRRDRYQRPIGSCTSAGQNLSCAMIARGAAIYVQRWDRKRSIKRECRL